ncbi:putative AAA+ superfamily ATPase [Parabacteroides sp. PFB2-10]|uniref:ATP-binding protein n=1 Tax=Parabacteroides sp. PFB2-10 TaxID=1742405 RepID=UPI002472F683|nr:AAA family ATPase [Parabacteroides sp. PFB2-10]MDH6311864.1 putative AAA+ superfamily ATPase [Parabacteroides sp. PFB2-10]MDL2244023.1 AAA family ATPase [Parabacteroides sp. OttesenSCG-928-J18]
MERLAIETLKKWKAKVNRKPLIVKGARQVGKTWLIKEFGKQEYAQTAYVNFESSKGLQSLFSSDFDIQRVIAALQIETGVRINATDTLIILDEIQEAEGGLTSLKYFQENAPEYHVIAAGSLLGVALHSTKSFPVGKVEFMDLYPLNFEEFLLAVKEEDLLDLLKNKDWILIKTFKDKYIHLLRQYYYVGGMPEVVSTFIQENDFNEIRRIQKDILISYEQDFSKHAPNEIVPRIRMLWNSIPTQLAKENKKFVYGLIKKGARAKEYEMALSWLIDCGLVYQINRISKPGIPLKAYEESSAFKLYIIDVGLLAAMGDIDVKTLLNGNAIFEEFKGSLTEQYVLQQIVNRDIPVAYWSADGGLAEVDFVVQHEGNLIPIEVKAEENLKAKSLKSYCEKYDPEVALRCSMSDYRLEEWLVNIPLYAIAVPS